MIEQQIVEIVNFDVVDVTKTKGIYRGGQPYTPSAWRALQAKGVQTIIKLNYGTEGEDDGAIKLGMVVIDCCMPPRDFWQAIGRPDMVDIDNALKQIDLNPKPVFIHCTHGQDRTGLIVGMYRVLHMGWTCQQAYIEMLQMGFHPELHDLHEAWEDFVAIEEKK